MSCLNSKLKITDRKCRILLIIVTLGIPFTVYGQIPETGLSGPEKLWEEISRYFSPPEKYLNNYGDYRSPLKFYDGSEVKTAEDWDLRRKEILGRWHGMLGEWPPFIETQDPEILNTTIKDGYLQHRVRFEWLPGQKTEGYLLIPHGSFNKPAVITVFYEPETAIGESDRSFLDLSRQLTKKGFVTLSLGTDDSRAITGAHSLYYPGLSNSAIEPLSVMAYAAANAWHLLAALPEVDPGRIGVMGHSYGGKWALFASCLFEKFACGVWSDPGIVFDESRPNVNYWEPWYLGYYPPPWEKTWRRSGDVEGARGLYPKLLREGYDLHELHALMAPRPFLVSAGSEDPPDRWKALNHTIDVNRILGYSNRVGMTNRLTHSQDRESNEQILVFFEYFLKNNGINLP
jgi:hypothetical protein